MHNVDIRISSHPLLNAADMGIKLGNVDVESLSNQH